MKKFMLALGLALLTLPAFGQSGTMVKPQPDCIIPFQFTAAGTTADFNNKGRYDATGQFVGGCTTWHMEYASTGFSVDSMEFQGAPDATGVAGTYVTWGSTIGSLATGTTLPLTSITQSQATGYRYSPWVRVKATTLTGTGTVIGVLMGWRPLSGQDANSATGVLPTVDSSGRTIVVGCAATGAAVCGNPVYVGFRDQSGNAQPWDFRNSGGVNYPGLGNAAFNAQGSALQIIYPFGANNASAGVFAVSPSMWNGTAQQLDKAVSVVGAGGDATGAGIQAFGPYGQFDDVSTGSVTENQYGPFRLDKVRAVRVNTEGQKATYSAAAVNFTPAATPTDVCVLPGSASKTIRVTRIMVQGFATTKGSMALVIVKRTTADTGGTSAALTVIPYDSGDAAGTAAPLKYTANPTINSTVGTYDTKSLNFAVAGDESTPYIFDTSYRGGAKALVLRGVAEQIAVNLSGAAVPTGGTIGCSYEWTEE